MASTSCDGEWVAWLQLPCGAVVFNVLASNGALLVVLPALSASSILSVTKQFHLSIFWEKFKITSSSQLKISQIMIKSYSVIILVMNTSISTYGNTCSKYWYILQVDLNMWSYYVKVMFCTSNVGLVIKSFLESKLRFEQLIQQTGSYNNGDKPLPT
jgi:hypothetical protein